MEALFGRLSGRRIFLDFHRSSKFILPPSGTSTSRPKKKSDLWYIIYHLWYIYHISMTYIHDIYHISIYDTVFLDPRCQWSVGMGISGFPIQKKHQNGWFTIPAIHPFTIPAIPFPWWDAHGWNQQNPGAREGGSPRSRPRKWWGANTSSMTEIFHQQLLDDRWIGIE